MPRWRTMIEPAETSWPSPAFTPNRWPTLSRPFFELDPAFLWAMAYWSFLVRWRFGLAPPAVSSPFESVVLPFAGAVFGAEAFASPADALAVPAFAERGLGDPVFVDPASSALAAPRLARVPVAAFCTAVAAFDRGDASAFPSAVGAVRAASFAATAASSAAWRAAASASLWRSVLAGCSALRASSAGLLPSNPLSLM